MNTFKLLLVVFFTSWCFAQDVDCPGFEILEQPEAQSACLGESASFSVVATGAGTPTYQWRKDCVPLVGETAATLTIDAVTDADYGWYSCTVTDDCGVLHTIEVPLDRDPELAITQQPIPFDFACLGDPYTLGVTATGATTFQWRKDCEPILGATSSTYEIDAVLMEDLGNYDCVVGNSCAVLTSTTANLMAQSIPTVELLTFDITCEDAAGSLFAIVNPTTGVTYQWFKDDVALVGEVSRRLRFNSLDPDDSGEYFCRVQLPCGPEDTETFDLAVQPKARFTSQPQSQSVCEGDTTTFAVVAEGPAEITYRWQKDGNDLPDSNTPTLILEDVDADDLGQYRCFLSSGECDGEVSETATLSLDPDCDERDVNCPGFAIVQQPQNQTACLGESASFSVTAIGEGTLSYQWRKNGFKLDGATASTLILDSVTDADYGSYSCTVSDNCGVLTTIVVHLDSNVELAIRQDPMSNYRACQGESFTFSVVAEGATSYQWRRDCEPIEGATDSSYTIESIGPDDFGKYDCVVMNACAVLTSKSGILFETPLPSIEVRPVQTTCVGENASLWAIVVPGGAVDAYQWYKDGEPLAGEIASVLQFSPLSTEDSGSYFCRLELQCGSVDTETEELVIEPPASFTSQPESQTVCPDQTVTLSVTATGPQNITYRWQKDEVDIPGADAPTLVIEGLDENDVGDYRCFLSSGDCGGEASQVATLSLDVNCFVTDPELRTFLVDATWRDGENDVVIDLDDNGLISQSEAELVTGVLDVSGLGIEDLVGISFFANLTGLICADNRLTGLPAELGDMANLKTLDASGNQIDHLPDFSTTSLTFLDLSNNRLPGASRGLGGAFPSTLESLALDSNAFSSLPSLVGLPELHVFTIAGNQISDFAGLSADNGIGDESQDRIALEYNRLGDQPSPCTGLQDLIDRIAASGAELSIDPQVDVRPSADWPQENVLDLMISLFVDLNCGGDR